MLRVETQKARSIDDLVRLHPVVEFLAPSFANGICHTKQLHTFIKISER